MSSNTNADRRVTEQDVAGALVALGVLPKRLAVEPKREFAGYLVGLDGVLASDLAGAVVAVLQGSLRHGFFPSPPELRMASDQVRVARLEAAHAEADKAARQQRIEEQLADRRAPTRSPQEVARIAAIHRRFTIEHEMARGGDEPIDAIRSRYADEKLARIRDQPEGSEAWRRYHDRLAVDALRRERQATGRQA